MHFLLLNLVLKKPERQLRAMLMRSKKLALDVKFTDSMKDALGALVMN